MSGPIALWSQSNNGKVMLFTRGQKMDEQLRVRMPDCKCSITIKSLGELATDMTHGRQVGQPFPPTTTNIALH